MVESAPIQVQVERRRLQQQALNTRNIEQERSERDQRREAHRGAHRYRRPFKQREIDV